MLENGGQNRGVKAAVRKFSKRWARIGCPLIMQIADRNLEDIAAVVEQLAEQPSIQGIELLVADSMVPILSDLVACVHSCTDFPVWLKVPLDRATEVASAAAEAGADGLVLGRFAPVHAAGSADGALLSGIPFGPFLFPQMLDALVDVAALDLPLTLIACGGIHTVDQAQTALAAGAGAIQLDSAIWVEPGLPAQLVAALG